MNQEMKDRQLLNMQKSEYRLKREEILLKKNKDTVFFNYSL